LAAISLDWLHNSFFKSENGVQTSHCPGGSTTEDSNAILKAYVSASDFNVPLSHPHFKPQSPFNRVNVSDYFHIPNILSLIGYDKGKMQVT